MDRLKLKNTAFPRSLSDVDKSVILVAQINNAMILSSDKAVRNFAKTSAIEYHVMLWIFDQLIELYYILSDSTNSLFNTIFLIPS